MNTFLCYDRCTTCQKAESWLKEHEIPYKKRPIKEDNPDAAELQAWVARSGLPLRRFFNTSGLLYRQLGLKDIRSEQSYSRCRDKALLSLHREQFCRCRGTVPPLCRTLFHAVHRNESHPDQGGHETDGSRFRSAAASTDRNQR